MSHASGDLTLARLRAGLVRDTDIVYAAQHGCTFSSFGLAEITCNRERVYRAVGYLLASRLISQRWLGSPKGLNDTRYQKMAKADTAPFTCDNLMLDLYKTPAEGNFLAVAKEDCRKVRERNPASGAAEIDKLITRHDAETLPGGRAYQAASDRAAQLIGSPEHLGPARDQLRRTARKRANELGMLVATELLAHHRRCFTENTETASQQTCAARDRRAH